MKIRKSCFSGSFYPSNKKELLKYIEYFNNTNSKKSSFKTIKAIISPHAGYVYSGFTANLAYKIASKEEFTRIVVIGPSHRVYLKGASVSLYEEYETPFGNLKIDLEYSKKLIQEFNFLDFNKECDFEHSTETQAPFIKHYFNNSYFVEIIYGDIDYKNLVKVIERVLKDNKTLVVISSDLSHFYTQDRAIELDNICLNAIERQDLNLFDYCEACGKTGIKAIVEYSILNDFKAKVLHYCTSADFSKDENRVVGYTSAIIGK